MKSNHKLVLAVLLGIATGVAGNSVARARQIKTPKAYIVAEPEIIDPTTFQKYAEKVPETLVPYGGRVLARAGKNYSVEGDAPKRLVIIEFESVQKARDWYDSPAYSEIRKIRFASAKTRLFIVEGVAPQ